MVVVNGSNILFISKDDTQANFISVILQNSIGCNVEIMSDIQEITYKIMSPNSTQLGMILLNMDFDDITIYEMVDMISEAWNDLPILLLTDKQLEQNKIISLVKRGIQDIIVLQDMEAHDELLSKVRSYINVGDKRNAGEMCKLDCHKKDPLQTIIARSPCMDQVVRKINNFIKDENIHLLLQGGIGVGKKEIAKTIHHDTVKRNEYPFIVCPTEGVQFLDAMIFGNSITLKDMKYNNHHIFGKIREASGGTLYIEEISNLPIAVQDKLVMAIQNGYASNNICKYRVDTRFILSTSHDIFTLHKQKKLSSKLFFFFSDFHINIPDLIDRQEDIIPLAEYYLQLFNKRYNKNITCITGTAKGILQSYEWPGNVRELKTAINSAVLNGNGSVLDVDDIESILEKNQELKNSQILKSFNMLQDDFNTKSLSIIEHELAKNALSYYQNDIGSTAAHLGISSRNLQKLLQSKE